jgi:hypothetical protein
MTTILICLAYLVPLFILTVSVRMLVRIFRTPKSTLIVNVTAKHIARGKARTATSCPVALAMEDAGFSTAAVGPSTFLGRWHDEEIHGETPPEVRAFVAAFDMDLSVSPFTFTLTLP